MQRIFFLPESVCHKQAMARWGIADSSKTRDAADSGMTERKKLDDALDRVSMPSGQFDSRSQGDKTVKG